jgi:transcriptional regulator with GAF, ATPase, and Fis domain
VINLALNHLFVSSCVPEAVMKGSRQRISPVPETGTPEQTLSQQECEERLRFEVLLTDLSSRFCTLAPEKVDNEIEDTLRRVCEFLGLGLSAVWERKSSRPDSLFLTHLYRAVEGPPVPETMEAREVHPWSFDQVLARRTVVLDSVEDAPPEAARDLETWHHFGVKTTTTIPLFVGEEPPFGAVSFNDMESERVWKESLVNRLQMVAEIIANAITRKRKDRVLRLSEARLKLAADAAGAGLWSLNLDSKRFWVTGRARSQFELPKNTTVTLDHVLARVHPEDLERITAAIGETISTGREIDLEYRIVLDKRGVRWMASKGRVQNDLSDDASPVLLGATTDITDRKIGEQELRRTFAEVKTLREQLQNENLYLKAQIGSETGHKVIVGESEPVKEMLVMARNVAATDATVLITGETGTGKELLAKAIHDLSPRGGRTMVKVNCAALPAPLIESELFGRERGAYTGALTRQPGRFEVANGSTIMLDEISDLPLDLQTKLLRVLESGTFERLGCPEEHRTNARVIAATNRDLGAMVARGEFREDLFHRLNVFPIEVPPLRDRTSDIPLLVWRFVQDFNEKMGRSIDSVPKATMRKIREYPWPGNVRELRNVIERAMILSTGNKLILELPTLGAGTERGFTTLEKMERNYIRKVLEHVNWRISGKGGAAEILGMVPTTLHSRLKKLGLERPKADRAQA